MKNWNKPLHIMKRIVSALMAVVFVIISTSSNSEAAAFGLPSVSLHKVYYNGTRIKHIAYNGTTVWSYGGTITFHAKNGDSTVAITDWSQVEPTYNPSTQTGTNTGTYKFVGWHKGSKGTSKTDISGAEAIDVTTNPTGCEYYAVYVHRHQGDPNNGGGCYTKIHHDGTNCGNGTIAHQATTWGEIYHSTDPEDCAGHDPNGGVTIVHCTSCGWYKYDATDNPTPAAGGNCPNTAGYDEVKLTCGKTSGAFQDW